MGYQKENRLNVIQRKVIVCFLVASLIPVIVIGIISYFEYHQVMTKKISEYSLAQLTQIVANVQLKLAEFENISVRLFINKEFNQTLVDFVKANKTGVAETKNKVELYFNDYMISNSDLFALMFFNDQDDQRSIIVTKDYYQDFSTLIKHFKKQSAYRDILRASGGIVWSSAIKVNRNHFVILGRHINDLSTGRPLGVLAIIIDEEKIDRLINMNIYNQLNISFDKIDNYSVVINNNGEIVSTPFKDDIGKNITMIMKDTEPLQRIFRPISDRDYGNEINQGTFSTEINHKQTLVTFKTISSKIGVGGRSGWHLLSLAPGSYLYAEMQSIGLVTMVLGLAFGLGAVGISLYVLSSIKRMEEVEG